MPTDPTFWNNIADDYAAKPLENPEAFERKIEVMKSHLRPTDTVLDVGCGTGSLALRLAPFAGHVHGLDVSTEMMRIARDKQAAQGLSNVTFHTGAFDETFRALPFDGVDLLCACSILHLVDDREAVLAHMFRLLRPGGTFVASTACLGESWVPYAPILTVMRWAGKAPPVWIFTRQTLVEELRRAGFVDVEAPEVGSGSQTSFLIAKRPAATRVVPSTGGGVAATVATLLMVAALALPNVAAAQTEPTPDDPPARVDPKEEYRYRYTASSPYLTFTNFDPDSAVIYELHFGYRITPKDTLALKAVTWKLHAPLGIPWGPYLANESEYYPGTLRETGVGLSYQRFLWKGLYASLQVVPLAKTYLDESRQKVDDGFRLYTSYHVGYYLPLFKNRLYVEPQVHCNYWPVDTEAPAAFAPQDTKWDNNYFLFEPNVMLGFNFGRKREDGRFVP